MVTFSERNKLSWDNGTILLNGAPPRIVMTRNKVCVGCFDIDPDIIKYLYLQHKSKFPEQQLETEYEIQSGIKA